MRFRRTLHSASPLASTEPVGAQPVRAGVVAVIPARAGSRRVPGKNIRPFRGQPLIVWSVRAALACGAIDRTIVSTDDPRVTEAVAGLPVDVQMRPPELATDIASTHDVLRHVDAALGGDASGPELMVLLQPTSPLRERDQIGRGIAAMRQHPDADRLIEVTSQALFTGRIEDGWWLADFPETTRSQDLPPLWYPSGRLYIYRCANVFGAETGQHDRCLAQTAPHERCTNIDHERDFLWAEHVYDTFALDYQHLE